MDIAAEFNSEFDAALAALVKESGHQVSDWLKAGVMKPETQVENWRQLGPEVVQNFITWFEESSYTVWVTPDNQPAIELELDVKFGEVPVKQFIDLVLAADDGTLLLVDLKSGSIVPNKQQLGFYACGLELKYGAAFRPERGAYFMARGLGKNKDYYISEELYLGWPELSVAFFTQQLEAMNRGRAAGAFVANVGKHCFNCDVADYCAAVGGKFSQLSDPSHPLH